MGKPSIFSRDYNNRMKKRKKRIAIFIIISITLIAIFSYSSNFKNFFNNKLSTLINMKLNRLNKKTNKNDIKLSENEKTSSDMKSNPEASTENIEEKGIEVALSDGIKLQAVYENKDGSNKFKYVTPIDAPVNFSVNPSGDAMVILENNTQNMFYVSIDGKVQKVNDTKYISSTGEVFPKESILKTNTDYIWCSSPKFIDDNNVAYISEVPWFKRTTKYVWVFNIKDNKIKDRNDHTLCKQFDKELGLEDLGGDNVKFGNLTDKGLEVLIDNKIKYIKYNGQFIETSD